jgi:dienelactone hydrolase
MTKRERVQFDSAGACCTGYLFLPSAEADLTATISDDQPGSNPRDRIPLVILAHGFSGTMDRLLPHAERFARAGLAALVFDYRGFGESAGSPRQVVDLASQRRDIRAALAWARSDPRVDRDRIALWGNSLGGAHVVTVAADDPGVDAVVAQIPFNGYPRETTKSAGERLRLVAAMVWDAVRGKLGLSPAYIKMIGAPGELAAVTTTAAQQHLATLTGDSADTLWRNQIAPRGLLQMTAYRPAAAAARLQAPLLVCIAADDTETPPERSRALAAAAPSSTVREYPGTHFDFYRDPALRDRVLADQVHFLCSQLAA